MGTCGTITHWNLAQLFTQLGKLIGVLLPQLRVWRALFPPWCGRSVLPRVLARGTPLLDCALRGLWAVGPSLAKPRQREVPGEPAAPEPDGLIPSARSHSNGVTGHNVVTPRRKAWPDQNTATAKPPHKVTLIKRCCGSGAYGALQPVRIDFDRSRPRSARTLGRYADIRIHRARHPQSRYGIWLSDILRPAAAVANSQPDRHPPRRQHVAPHSCPLSTARGTHPGTISRAGTASGWPTRFHPRSRSDGTTRPQPVRHRGSPHRKCPSTSACGPSRWEWPN